MATSRNKLYDLFYKGKPIIFDMLIPFPYCSERISIHYTRKVGCGGFMSMGRTCLLIFKSLEGKTGVCIWVIWD